MAPSEMRDVSQSENMETITTSLLNSLLANTTAEKRTCSMSVSIYDTAWASMIAKPSGVQANSEWLFPMAFEFLLKNQAHDGSWASQRSELDGILSTMAGLLALLEHQASPATIGCNVPGDMILRLGKAVTWLDQKLRHVDLDSCNDNVGFEILLPSLSRLIRKHGVDLNLSRFSSLSGLKDDNSGRFEKLIQAMYQGHQVTALHSLEAFIGKIDFDQLKGSKRMGGMLGSPSSTAAYLMYSSEWDDEAEQFLRDAMEKGNGGGSGAFASAHVIDYFEISWILSTILESKLEVSNHNRLSIEKIGDYLQTEFKRSKGLMGFSRHMLPDADDTAKCIYSLQMLGHSPDPQPLVAQFQTPKVFKTYQLERTPSLSTNCNVLKALVSLSDANQYVDSIRVALDFICQAWFSGQMSDKWNIANEYAYMLIAQGLTTLVAQRDAYPTLSSYFDFKIPVILSQILSRILQTQSGDGSWASRSHEITAYCVLSLISLSAFAFPTDLNATILSAIETGRGFLKAGSGKWEARPIWIEKVLYSSTLLTDAYCACALSAQLPSAKVQTATTNKASASMLGMFRALPLFSGCASIDLVLKCALAESSAFLPYLQSTRLDIFPRSKDLKKEKYMAIIPFAWTACNALRASPLPAELLLEMMSISLLNFQADEYFELITTRDNGPALVMLINDVCGVHMMDDLNEGKQLEPESDLPTPPNGLREAEGPLSDSLQPVSKVLTDYANRVLQHTAVLASEPSTKVHVRHTLAAYLRAQVKSALNRSSTAEQRTNGKTLFDWVRTLGADDTSSHYSFAFYTALSRSVFKVKETTSIVAKDYLMRALSGNLATMCRMYNDYGSLSRDQDEGNLNCLDFFNSERKDISEKRVRDLESCEKPVNGKRMRREDDSANGRQEEHSVVVTDGSIDPTTATLPCDNRKMLEKTKTAKLELMQLANYEKSCAELTLSNLQSLGLKGNMLEALLLFIDVVDLFGQIYVARDIGTRTK